MNKIIISIILGYAFGCFQSSYFIGRIFKGVDIRTLGNGNAGASNTSATLGFKYGIVVAILDILKPILSIAIIKYMFSSEVALRDLESLIYLNGLFVIIGHNYPFYLNFKGGKGTASLIGLLLSIDLKLGISAIILMFLITVITDYIALGTMTLVIAFVVYTIYSGYSLTCILISMIIASLSIYHHLPNMKNIKNGEEKGLRQTLKKKH